MELFLIAHECDKSQEHDRYFSKNSKAWTSDHPFAYVQDFND